MLPIGVMPRMEIVERPGAPRLVICRPGTSPARSFMLLTWRRSSCSSLITLMDIGISVTTSTRFCAVAVTVPNVCTSSRLGFSAATCASAVALQPKARMPAVQASDNAFIRSEQ
ncbi:hypothetical protein D3C71_1617640 [compost metagenome]